MRESREIGDRGGIDVVDDEQGGKDDGAGPTPDVIWSVFASGREISFYGTPLTSMQLMGLCAAR